jgi:hypothetical protein
MNYIFHGYGDYSIPLLYEGSRSGLRIIEVPFVYQFRKNGTSKTAVFKTGISYGIRALKLRFGLDGLDYYLGKQPIDSEQAILQAVE